MSSNDPTWRKNDDDPAGCTAPPKTHGELRSVLCLFCTCRTNTTITENAQSARWPGRLSLASKVRDYYISGFTPDNPRLPRGVCPTCRQTLLGKAKSTACPPWPELNVRMGSLDVQDDEVHGKEHPCLLCPAARDRAKYKGRFGAPVRDLQVCVQCLNPYPGTACPTCGLLIQ